MLFSFIYIFRVWQHVICMALTKKNIPDKYYCELCSPRVIDCDKAKSLQVTFLASKGGHKIVADATTTNLDQPPTQQQPNQNNAPNEDINQVPVENQTIAGLGPDGVFMNKSK